MILPRTHNPIYEQTDQKNQKDQTQNQTGHREKPTDYLDRPISRTGLVMPPGSYRGRRLDFSQFTADRFQPHLFLDDFRRSLGCGFSALALLTGVYPEMIVSQHHGSHCSDAFMLRFLRRQGCRTWRLTQCALTQSGKGIGNNHVLLLSQLFRQNEGTWVVACDGMAYHNFQMYALDVLSLLNKPILSAYLVIHPDWRNPEPAPPLANHATDTKKQWLSWHLLRPKTSPRIAATAVR